jgi:DUF1365 family protein
MGLEPGILVGKVMHGRLFPKKNIFSYGIYYLAFPLSKIDILPLGRRKFSPLSFHMRDHGACDGSALEPWARTILRNYKLDNIANGEIILVCMPRILGHVFNPVSFWLCHDVNSSLRAVLCEVHNTFGERHTYLCAHTDHRPILPHDILKAEKVFHVSPLLKREGFYTFRFMYENNQFGAWIDYYDTQGAKQLVTYLKGHIQPMNRQSLRYVFWAYPLVTLKAVTLIHWQALKLLMKGIGYIKRPPQITEHVSTTHNLTKI